MKTAFAAALALSLLSGTAMAAPSDMRGDHQGQRTDQAEARPDRGDRGDRGSQSNSHNNGQVNSNQPRGNAPQQSNNGGGNRQGQQQSQNDHRGNDGRDNDRGYRHDNDRRDYDRHDGDRRDYDRRDGDHRYGNNDRNGSRGYEYNGRRYHAVRGPVWHAPRGYDARRAWNRGDRLPASYRDRSYVIDYRVYGLGRPPYGYQWVRVSNNVFLVNAYNGLITQIVFSMFY
ncbi:MAG: RcnB family protein [Pseudomonadota bacterium]